MSALRVAAACTRMRAGDEFLSVVYVSGGCGSVGWVTVVLLTGTRGAAAGNSIGDARAAAIAEALKVNKTVTMIDLWSALRAAGAPTARGARRVRGLGGRHAAHGRAGRGGRQLDRRLGSGRCRRGARGERDGHGY